MLDLSLYGLNTEAALSVASTAITGLLAWAWHRYSEARPKVIAYFLHSADVYVPGRVEANPLAGQPNNAVGAATGAMHPPAIQHPGGVVNTHVLVIRNNGGKSATNVRLGHSTAMAYSVWPQTNYVVRGTEICFPKFMPDQQISITYVYSPPLIWRDVHTYLQCDEMLVKQVQYLPAPMFGIGKRIVLLGLMFIGAVTVIYWVLRLLTQFVTLGT